MRRPEIVIVTPALAPANSGNWQTARRWARMLSAAYRVTPRCALAVGGDEDLMIALHARRSAASVRAWRQAFASRPLLLVLTGTDLYRDIDSDADAQRSLALADALVVLNSLGPQRLPEALRAKCHVVLQSCTARRTLPKTGRHLRALMVGHLRDEKDPLTYLRAAMRLAGRSRHAFRPYRRGARRGPGCTGCGAGRATAAATAGSARCRMPPCAATSRPRTCWCMPAAWKAARTW